MNGPPRLSKRARACLHATLLVAAFLVAPGAGVGLADQQPRLVVFESFMRFT